MIYSTPAIVCEAEILSAISTIQSLGKLGVPVFAISSDKDAVGFASRYVSKKFHSNICCGTADFADYLIKNIPPGVIFCGSDSNAEVIAKNKSKLVEHGFLLTVPDYDTMLTLYDKHQLHLFSSRIGIKTPRSVLLKSVDDLEGELEDVSQEQILKPTKGAGGHYYRLGKAADPAEIYKKLSIEIRSPEYEHQSSQIMLQEYVDFKGKLWNYNGLYQNGELIADFSGLRLRTPEKQDGSLQSSLLHGVSKKNNMLSVLNHKLFKAITYSGLVETEWLVDESAGKYVLFDVNPRLAGNISWSIKGGVDLPCMYYRLTIGENIDSTVQQKEGVTYHKLFWNKIDLLEACCGRSSSNESLLVIIASNLKALLSPRNSAIDVLSYKDLGPTMQIIKNMFKRFFKRLNQRATNQDLS